MRFDDDSQLDTSQVRDTRGRGGFSGFPRRGGVAIGGGAGILGLVVFILLQLLGGGGTTTSGALPGIDQVQGETGNLAEECKTGADANAKLDCRVVAVVNSVQDFWAAEFERRGAQYQQAPTTLFSGGVQTGCGTASSDVGPFYCPRDATVYIDLSFYRDLQTKFGAQGGPFAQAYVLAHEYGHHVQNLTGTMDEAANARSTGPQGASTRLELQADCYAGLWANHATTEPGPDGGDPLVERITAQDIADGLDAAAAIGDDTIQQRFQGQVSPETWTHGSSAQRQRWFTTGYRTGDLDQCNTFRGSV
ncbi:MAG TPA: neutral zinc metallopeptidase [Actinomycetes bacterium]|nr:neutral zinc metallopeptidase [Actinomycetes bacterium]